MMKLICDPPSGWRYGFPKPIPEKCTSNDMEFRKYLTENGYPDSMLDLASKHSRFWEQEEA